MSSRRFPVFVPSKGRHETMYTMKALTGVGVPFYAVIEEQEHDAYAAALSRLDGQHDILVVPHRDKGVVVTRNWIWDYAASLGAERYWTFDDNIRGFYRYNRNLKVPVADAAIFDAMEDFTLRYTNVPISGMHYHMFVSRKTPVPPYTANTRVYSNMFIETFAKTPAGIPYRWEGFFNEDTDLCLRMLKDGFCMVLFNAFLIDKAATMTMKGGNSGNYEGDGRWKMAEELRLKHPDVTVVTRKWGRWQHHVDYSGYRKNRLERRPDVDAVGVNDFGMVLEVQGADGIWRVPEVYEATPR